ncbi:LysR family transcriptional regulator [Amycolatopsis anabasis]|uniref:LysR family transcriptional regulator n=1 Tax=Amycolatopsis anabasis TaxID=1840409 RepID=UPI00131AFC38|nr:LysR family transcriptional regulator [Amycolatopsis anabasis]
MELDLGAVRAFVAVTDERNFGAAADRLGLTQQAISKRIAKLEADLGVPLVRRSRGGAGLTKDGEAFLAHARGLIGLADQATESVRRRHGALRVDVLSTKLASTELLRAFHELHGEVAIDIVTSNGLRSAHPALVRGSIDAAFARVTGTLDEAITWAPAYLEPMHLLVGHKHRLAGRKQVRFAELAGSTARMPGNVAGSEWAEFYLELAADYDIRIDNSGPNFGDEYLMEKLSQTDEWITFGGEKTRQPWHPRVARIPITRPAPVYPMSLLWRRDNRHPALPSLLDHVTASYRRPDPRDVLLPAADRAGFGLSG